MASWPAWREHGICDGICLWADVCGRARICLCAPVSARAYVQALARLSAQMGERPPLRGRATDPVSG